MRSDQRNLIKLSSSSLQRVTNWRTKTFTKNYKQCVTEKGKLKIHIFLHTISYSEKKIETIIVTADIKSIHWVPKGTVYIADRSYYMGVFSI